MARNKNSELNKLVRDRFPGGAELISALASCDRMVQDRHADEHAQDLLQLLRTAADLMREHCKQTKRWPPPTYSATEVAELSGIPKRTVNEICRRNDIGELRNGRLAITVNEALAVKSLSQGRPGAPAGNTNRTGNKS